MTLSSEQFHTLYDGAAQPVILVRDGAVAELNCHAQELFAVGTALRAYLPQDAALPEMLYARPAVLPVMAGGVCGSANTQPLDDALLLFLPPQDTRDELAAFCRAAQSISTPLTTLLSVSGTLFPLLSEAEDPAVQQNLAVLNRACYQLLRASENLTDLSYVQHGRLPLSLEKTDLTDENARCREKRIEKGSVEFRNVSFRYFKNSEDAVLSHINLKIPAGTTVGIIGSTGCGKTSLVSLIPRLYDADEGEVLVDGVNVKDYSLYNLREGVGMVLQKNVLFSGSIADNLRWGDDGASDEEMIHYAGIAQADKFVSSFKDGYATELDQGGTNLSGGQKQRLCIARALLKKPKILILDDSTSAVDTATEAQIRKAFREELKDSTKIIIAQRIGSVKDADTIIVMDDGRITGVGTHEELLKNNEEYREICSSQTDGKEA